MIHIATICGMGLGTSMMLKLFIDDVLKEEGIKAETMPWDLGTFRSQQADIVVAASDMSTHLKNTPAIVVLIRNLVDKQEIRAKILAAIQQYNQSKAAR